MEEEHSAWTSLKNCQNPRARARTLHHVSPSGGGEPPVLTSPTVRYEKTENAMNENESEKIHNLAKG